MLAQNFSSLEVEADDQKLKDNFGGTMILRPTWATENLS